MAAKLVLLLNCLIAANCRSSIPSSNDVAYVEPDEWNDEIESIRQLLMNVSQASIRNEMHAIQEMKSDIEEIREAVIQQQNRPRKGLLEALFHFHRAYTLNSSHNIFLNLV